MSGKGLQGRHVLYALLAFFGVMLIANGIFVYYALGTFGGGDTSDPYRKGLHYNDTLAEAAKQAERGWTARIGYDKESRRIGLDLRGPQQEPVRGLKIGGLVGRPATDREDVAVVLSESAPGTYAAAVDLGPGQWVVLLHSQDLSRAGNPTYQVKQRIFVDAGP